MSSCCAPPRPLDDVAHFQILPYSLPRTSDLILTIRCPPWNLPSPNLYVISISGSTCLSFPQMHSPRRTACGLQAQLHHDLTDPTHPLYELRSGRAQREDGSQDKGGRRRARGCRKGGWARIFTWSGGVGTSRGRRSCDGEGVSPVLVDGTEGPFVRERILSREEPRPT